MDCKSPNPVTWFEIYVDDMERASKFYETVFAIQFTDLTNPTSHPMHMRAFPSQMGGNGAAGSIVKMEGMKAGGGNVLIYFSCEDCSVEQSRVEAAGGKVFNPKMSIGEYGFCALVVDTEGNTIGLHSLK